MTSNPAGFLALNAKLEQVRSLLGANPADFICLQEVGVSGPSYIASWKRCSCFTALSERNGDHYSVAIHGGSGSCESRE